MLGIAIVITIALAGAAYIWPDSFASGTFPGVANSRYTG